MHCHRQIKTYSLACERFKYCYSYVGVNPQQSVGLGEKLLLQRDDNDLHVAAGLLSKETGHLDSEQQFGKTKQKQENKI